MAPVIGTGILPSLLADEPGVRRPLLLAAVADFALSGAGVLKFVGTVRPLDEYPGLGGGGGGPWGFRVMYGSPLGAACVDAMADFDRKPSAIGTVLETQTSFALGIYKTGSRRLLAWKQTSRRLKLRLDPSFPVGQSSAGSANKSQPKWLLWARVCWSTQVCSSAGYTRRGLLRSRNVDVTGTVANWAQIRRPRLLLAYTTYDVLLRRPRLSLAYTTYDVRLRPRRNRTLQTRSSLRKGPSPHTIPGRKWVRFLRSSCRRGLQTASQESRPRPLEPDSGDSDV